MHLTTRAISWGALGLFLLFAVIVVANQVFRSSGLDGIGLGLFLLMLVALLGACIVPIIRFRQDKWASFVPAVLLALGLSLGWQAATNGGTWIRERWLLSEIAMTEEVMRLGARAGNGAAFAAELPPSARAACSRIEFHADSAGNLVGYCRATRNLIYAYDPGGSTESDGWTVREPFAPDWYRLRP
jgi:hypothetical protein